MRSLLCLMAAVFLFAFWIDYDAQQSQKHEMLRNELQQNTTPHICEHLVRIMSDCTPQYEI